MEIHHRLCEKSINYSSTITAAVSDPVPVVICDTNAGAPGIPGNSNFSSSVSPITSNTDRFVPLNRTTLNTNEFPSYSSTSTGSFNHSTTSDLSIDLTSSREIAVIADRSSETKNDLNSKITHRYHQHHLQEQSRQLLSSRNVEKNIGALVETLTTASLQAGRTDAKMVITTKGISSCSGGSNGANVSSNNSNRNGAAASANEPKSLHRIPKVIHFQIFSSSSPFPHLIFYNTALEAHLDLNFTLFI